MTCDTWVICVFPRRRRRRRRGLILSMSPEEEEEEEENPTTTEMVKKRVPDWLNSSIWSSSTSTDEDHRLPTYSSILDPPVPPSNDPNHNHIRTSVQEEPEPEPEPEPEAEPGAGPSVEDISRQAQLLSEVSFSFLFSITLWNVNWLCNYCRYRRKW